MKLFQQIGADIQRDWHRQEYDYLRFPSIAERALTAAQLPSELSLPCIADWLARQIELPRQLDLEFNNEFSDFALTVYETPEFCMDLLHWTDASTSVHQHSFSGAFTVVFGSSIHVRHRFTERERVSDHALIGVLEVDSIEYLRPGDVRRIEANGQLIHSVFHLDRPTLSAVVRTRKDATAAPQLSYLKPSLAIALQMKRERESKQIQCGNMLARLDSGLYLRYLETLLAGCDFHTAFLMLAEAHLTLSDDQFAHVLEYARHRQGSRVDVLRAVFAEESRVHLLLRLRESVHDPDLRFFMALLLNAPKRADVLRIVGERWPLVDPIDKVIEWTCRLMRQIAHEANEGSGDLFDDSAPILLRALMEDLPESELASRLTRQHSASPDELQAALLLARLPRLRASGVLRPLFTP